MRPERMLTHDEGVDVLREVDADLTREVTDLAVDLADVAGDGELDVDARWVLLGRRAELRAERARLDRAVLHIGAGDWTIPPWDAEAVWREIWR